MDNATTTVADRPAWEVAPPYPLKRYFLGDCTVHADDLSPDEPLYADAPTAEEAAALARRRYRIAPGDRFRFVQVLWRTEDGEEMELPLTMEATLEAARGGMADLLAQQDREDAEGR
jgi:hypothetical protein